MRRLLPILTCLLPLSAVAAPPPAPAHSEGPGVVERLGSQVPLDVALRDETGATVALEGLVSGRKPVILTLVYYECPMLCSMVLNGLVTGMRELEWSAGDEFEVVTLSINHLEGAELAQAKKTAYLAQLDRAGAADGWRFLTGTREEIKRLAASVGFGYQYIPEKLEYAHGAAIFVLSPDGTVVRTLYGVQYPAQQLRLALTEAGAGGFADSLALWLYRYDSDTRRYLVDVGGVMRTGGLVTAVIVGLMLLVFWRRSRRLGSEPPLAVRADATRAPKPGGVA